MTRTHVAVLVYLGAMVLAVTGVAVVRGMALGWPWAVGPALLTGVIAFGLAGHLWWRRRTRAGTERAGGGST
jgi:hypothetical protein